MRKFLIILTTLFIANVGCKKANIDGGRLCGCSPVVRPTMNLVIKNTAGVDLLDDKIAGAYSKDKIKLFRKGADGNSIPLNFTIRPPFSYGTEKFNFHILSSGDPDFTQGASNNVIYLQLGEGKTYELSWIWNQDKYSLEKLMIDKNEAEKATGSIVNYATIFYLTE